MGRFCRVCRCTRPNEYFSGRGHVCRDCRRLPVAHREAVEQKEEIFGFLRQSHISPRNCDRLRLLAASPHPEVAALASQVLLIASIHPYRRRRGRKLAEHLRRHPESATELGLEQMPCLAHERSLSLPAWLDDELFEAIYDAQCDEALEDED